MHKYSVGQEVKAVRGKRDTMNPERYNVGRVGTIVEQMPACDGMPYYSVAFGYELRDRDYIDEVNLEAV